MITQKAIKATIVLGSIELDVYQLPDGKYLLSFNQIAETIGISSKRLPEFRELSLAQTLYPQGFEIAGKLSIEGGTKPFAGISITDASKYWTLAAIQTQNLKAAALLAASQSEAIERRADIAFGILRTEQERNERYEMRIQGILSRHFWTDCIDAYCKTRPLDDGYSKWIYANVSNYLNKALFGMTSKQLQEHYGIGKHSPRDYFPSTTLRAIEALERATAMRVWNLETEPLQALKDMVGIMGYNENHLPL